MVVLPGSRPSMYFSRSSFPINREDSNQLNQAQNIRHMYIDRELRLSPADLQIHVKRMPALEGVNGLDQLETKVRHMPVYRCLPHIF